MVVTPSGILNSIGIQNSGVRTFIREELPLYRRYATNIIVSIAGETVDEYVEVAKMVSQCKEVNGIELNISCPNILKGGAEFGTDPDAAFEVVQKVKRTTGNLTVIAKLTPNVTDITVIARACQQGGADAISLINTVSATAIDIETFRPILGNTVGGLSGPAIKPIALLRVLQISNAFKANGMKVPIIGIGGITNGLDALEFIIAGASAVGIGTAGLVDRQIVTKVVEDIRKWLLEHYQRTHDAKFLDIKNLVGCVRLRK
jgi:dihydroorotate dehydrogenase (NAD+) catalytic subunit